MQAVDILIMYPQLRVSLRQLPFEDSQPYDKCHVIQLLINNPFPQNTYRFHLKNDFNIN